MSEIKSNGIWWDEGGQTSKIILDKKIDLVFDIIVSCTKSLSYE